MRLGVISDTHGLFRPEVRRAFAGVDHILHSGDIGGVEVLAQLRAIAPVTACAGNVDGFRCGDAGRTARIELGGKRSCWCTSATRRRRSCAGPRRFPLPICVGLLEVGRGRWRSRHLDLQ